MANQWYVQHGGKQYGPLTPANLKKLAADGKITPSTQVRLGDEGAWVSASRVQGLFVAQVKAPSAPQPQAKSSEPVKTTVPPVAAPSDMLPPEMLPPLAAPSPPPIARPLPRPAVTPVGRLAKAAPQPAQSMPARILGALALVFGILALATMWLPILGGVLGWTGIVVGTLGLLLGIAGFILSATNQGSGLALNIAGTSSSAVGLLLTVVLGVTFGMFTSKPAPPPVVPKPVAVVPQPAPAPPPVVEEEPEPEPEPEPVWTDASEAIVQGDIKATLSAAIEKVRLEGMDLSTLKPQKPQPMLKIKVTIENTSSGRILEVPGWLGGGDLVSQGLGRVLGTDNETGKALQAVTATAKLTDNAGNSFKQTPAMSLFGVQLPTDHALRPGESKQLQLVFPPPLANTEYLRIELSPAGFSGEEPLRFEIKRELIQGL